MFDNMNQTQICVFGILAGFAATCFSVLLGIVLYECFGQDYSIDDDWGWDESPDESDFNSVWNAIEQIEADHGKKGGD